MTETNENNGSLAGAHCPQCQEVCVYEVSDELARSGFESIQIACHACGHVFKTVIPEDKRLPAIEEPEAEDIAHTEEHLPEESPIFEEDEAAFARPEPSQQKPKRRMIYASLAGAMVLLFAIAGVMMVITSQNMRDNALAGLEEAQPVPQEVMPKTEDVALVPAQEEPADNEVAESPQPQPSVTANKDQFQITDRGYTISKNDLGTIMNIKVSVVNNGDAPAKPEKMVLHLMSPEGVILMTWPMVSTGDLIAPKSARTYSAQLIEPPQDAATLEVEIQ